MKLYPVHPIGLGTEHAESFSSYISRLSAAHGMSTGRFFDGLNSIKYRHDGGRRPEYLPIKPWNTLALVRPTPLTSEIVDLVEEFTVRNDLRCMTFLALEKLQSRSVDLFSNEVRWCPSCLQDDIDKGNPPYFRMIWSFKDVLYCHHHNVNIESKCPVCETLQRTRRRVFDVTLCGKCDAKLYEHVRPMETSQLYRDVCFRDLIELVRVVSSNPKLEYKPSDSLRLIDEILKVVWSINAEMGFWESVPNDESILNIRKMKPISVRNLRRIAYRLGVSFPGLLAGEAECWIPQLDPIWLSKLPSNLKPSKRRILVDRDELVIRLNSVKSSIDPSAPPSLAQVARIVGVSTGGLEYLHPKVCEDIKTHYQIWKRKERLRKYESATAEVLEYLHSDIVGKSRKHALRTIRARTNLPKNVLLKVIKHEFEKSQYQYLIDNTELEQLD